MNQVKKYFNSLTPRIIFQGILLDMLLEPILYFSLEDSLGEAMACGISSLPDAISILMSSILDSAWDPVQSTSMVVIFISSFLTLILHKAKLSQIPDALIPGVMGLSYIFSRNIDKPLVFYATRPWTTNKSKFFNIRIIDENWNKLHQEELKESLSVIWGIVLVIQSTIVSTLIFFLKMDTLIITNIILSVLIAILLNLWCFTYIYKLNHRYIDVERLIDTD